MAFLIPKCPICSNQMTAHSCMNMVVCVCGFEVDGETITRARGLTPESTQAYLKKRGRCSLRITGTISHTLAAPHYEQRHIAVSGTPSPETLTDEFVCACGSIVAGHFAHEYYCKTGYPLKITTHGSFESLIDRVEIDPLDVMYNGISLRGLLVWNERNQRECKTNGFTHRLDPTQRAAVSAHWSAELRAKVAASKERDKHQVMMQIDADDL